MGIRLTDKAQDIFFGDCKGIYAYMYGKPTINVVRNGKTTEEQDKVIFIEREKLEVDFTGLTYVWGWPGPDFNFYKYSDYGITWALTEEELLTSKQK